LLATYASFSIVRRPPAEESFPDASTPDRVEADWSADSA
jgi:hypothetical protein